VTLSTLVLETARFNDMDVETNWSALSPQPPPLTPELKDFIQRILVPILVDRYLEGRKKDASERLREYAVQDSPTIANKAPIQP
jgi:hypothetical protein